MPISIRQSQAGNIASQSIDDLYRALRDVQADLEQLRALLATHVHSGVTDGPEYPALRKEQEPCPTTSSNTAA